MKHKRACALLLVLCLLLCACGKDGGGEARGSSEVPKELRIAIASDLHYLSRELTDNGPLFQEVVARGDGKLMLDIEAITEAFTEQMIAEHPDLLILSGDLSFNGEYKSHVDLTEKLKRIENAGVQVLVLPGNHDINVSTSIRFEGEGYEQTVNIDAEEFHSLYGDYGYDEALSLDENSGSYVCEPCEGHRIIMLDTNSYVSNALSDRSLSWLEEQLKEAKTDGSQVITVSHQNILPHNNLFIFGYRILNADQIESLLQKYDVLAHFSGHMHIQHAASDDGITEVLTSPLSLVPCRYGLLNWNRNSLSYEAQSVDVSAWASKQGLADEKLLHFSDYARDSFYQNSYRQIESAYSSFGLSEQSIERMARCFAETNLVYFTGEALDREKLDRDLDFWSETVGEDFHTVYLRSILEDDAPDPLKIEFRNGEIG